MSHQPVQRMVFNSPSPALKHLNGTTGFPQPPEKHATWGSEEVRGMMYFPPLKMFVFADELTPVEEQVEAKPAMSSILLKVLTKLAG